MVGSAYTANNQYHAFLYSNGSMQDLGTLGGSYNSRATGINDSGQVVGTAYTANNQSHAFLYSNGSMQDLGTLGGSSSSASGINNSGQVVGNASTANNQSHAFLYSNGNMRDLGTLGGSYSSALGINNSGQVVGAADTGQFYHAFLYSNGSMQDLDNPLWGINSYATGINNSGQVVGQAYLFGQLPFLYSNGITQYLIPTSANHGVYMDGIATAINDSGQVVGDIRYSDFDGEYRSSVFLYSNGSMTDLSLAVAATGWRLNSAYDINDLGQIVGTGTNPDGQTHAFLLTPLEDTPTPVPAAAWLLGSGLAGLIGLRRRKNHAE